MSFGNFWGGNSWGSFELCLNQAFGSSDATYMAVKIRLQRQGAPKKPSYIVVAIPSEQPRNGAYLERLGQYFPKEKSPKAKLKLDREAFDAWVARGAVVSQTVGQLIRAQSQSK